MRAAYCARRPRLNARACGHFRTSDWVRKRRVQRKYNFGNSVRNVLVVCAAKKNSPLVRVVRVRRDPPPSDIESDGPVRDWHKRRAQAACHITHCVENRPACEDGEAISARRTRRAARVTTCAAPGREVGVRGNIQVHDDHHDAAKRRRRRRTRRSPPASADRRRRQVSP